jgi:histone-lysine N-methyltransferase SETMAR
LPKDHRFIKIIATCDEKWIYLNNPDLQKQWRDKGQLPLPVAKRKCFEKKVHLCVWWNYEGLIHYELLPDGRTVNAEVYSQQLEKMYTVLLEKYPGLLNRKRVLLQQDHARPNTAKKTLKKIEELGSIELLPHSAFSPDLAPSDYYLFRSMAPFLRGKNINL